MVQTSAKRPLPRPLKWLLVLVLLPILIPVAVLLIAVVLAAVIAGALWSSFLYAIIWLRWRRRDTLFVYSDSPIWKDYLQQQLFPRLGDRLLLLNWSERRTWDNMSLEVLAFNHWAGQRAFNPMALVFRPFKSVEIFRYWDAFKDFQHGDVSSVEQMNRQLLEALGVGSDRLAGGEL